LHALVTDHALCGNLDNLDVNLGNPFEKYVNSGSIYSGLAYRNCCNKYNDFLIEIIFAHDKTKLPKETKVASLPIMFTVISILNQQMHNLPIAWESWDTYLFNP
jgi:hypothetical protein